MAIKYNPDFLDRIPSLSEKESFLIQGYNLAYPLSRLLANARNVEALGIDFIHASAQIEGNTYSQIETEILIKEGQTAGGKKYSDARMILNLRSALDLVVNQEYEINKGFLFDLHSLICAGELEQKELGSVRSDEVLITGTDYVPLYGRDKINEELTYLLERLSQIDNVTERAIYAHLNLAYLQAFKDGNKRTARMMQTAIMIKSGLVPALFNKSHVTSYKESVLFYYETGDSTKYVTWFMKTYEELFEKLIPVEQEIKRSTVFGKPDQKDN
jgi:Fic family protein